MRLRATFLRWLAAMTVIALVALAAHGLGEKQAQLAASARADADLAILADSLRSTIGRYRQAPVLLAASARVLKLLENQNAPEHIEAANLYLEETATRLGAAQLFVMRQDGLTVSSSNWRDDDSFVGSNYAFRPYFREAVATGSGSYYAVGVTTGLPGYFLAADIRDGGALLGVAVVKIDLDPLETMLAKRVVPVMVADGDGVVIFASHSKLKYRPLRLLTDQQRMHIAAERRFASLELGGPITAADLGLAGEPTAVTRTLPLSEGDASWSITTYLPPDEIRLAANSAALLGALGAMVAILAATIFSMRSRFLQEERAAKRNLEGRVELRTIELRRAYQELSSEITERSRVDRELHRTRDDLAQAAKLAAMGQAFSGLAHEINQPLMALKTYLASLGKLIERDDREATTRHVAVMSETVDRMSELTNSLRRLARKEDRRIERLDLAEIAHRVVELMKFRLADIGAEVSIVAKGHSVLDGDPSRLQQVVLNLVMNAIDAVCEASERRIRIEIDGPEEAGSGQVRLSVFDTGAGVSPEVSHRLGEPFFTTKTGGSTQGSGQQGQGQQNQSQGFGLGLGLAISYSIIAEHGGHIAHEALRGDGTVFRVLLPAARQVRDPSEPARLVAPQARKGPPRAAE